MVRFGNSTYRARGDFNLIRTPGDKSSGVGDVTLMEAFNSFTEKFNLREIHRGGPKYTWANKQECPVQIE